MSSSALGKVRGSVLLLAVSDRIPGNLLGSPQLRGQSAALGQSAAPDYRNISLIHMVRFVVLFTVGELY